jgi:hypothetical protein
MLVTKLEFLQLKKLVVDLQKAVVLLKAEIELLKKGTIPLDDQVIDIEPLAKKAGRPKVKEL